jgi:type III restriction enzyme
MLQRVMPDLMGMKNVLALNDEAHHCYREKPGDVDQEEAELKGDDRKEAQKNREAARLWINGLEAVQRKLGLARVLDLSATPFFLRGSGYAEGVLFPWTLSDFSLMDAIVSGIVKLPRVPVADNIPGADMPVFRNLWDHIRKDMPKKGRGKTAELDPLKLPTRLKTALEALYGHYEKTFEPPCSKGEGDLMKAKFTAHCGWADPLHDSLNAIEFETQEEAVDAGYKPCNTCRA